MNEEEILYQIVAVDSEFKKGFPDKITTIFKNGITGKTYTDYDFKNHRYLYTFINDNFNIYDRLKEKDNEIDRLNNIINELENTIANFIENHTESYIDWKYDREIYLAESNILQKLCDTYFDKLKELKDSD